MDIAKKSRTELKNFFVKNAIPTERNFADLIDAMLNQKEDGIAKPAGNPLCIEATGDAGSLRKAINFFESFGDLNPSWALSLNPRTKPDDPTTAKPGFAISDPTGINRLFIDRTSGNVGIGTLSPGRVLEVSAADSNTGLKITGVDSNRSWLMTVGAVVGDSKLTFFDYGAATSRLTIDTAGNVGVGTTTPDRARLEVRGMAGNTVALFGDFGISLVASWPNVGFNSYFNGVWKSISPGFAGNIDVNQGDGSMNFYLASAQASAADVALVPVPRLTIAPSGVATFSGPVGIGTVPAFALDVRSSGRIKLGLEGSGGGQLQIACNTNDNSIFLEAYNAAGNASASAFWLTGMDSQNVPALNLQANLVSIAGDLRVTGHKSGYVVDQFINSVDDQLEQGDVVILGSNQVSLYYGKNNAIPVPEVDLTTRALDTRVCGIVHSVHGNVVSADEGGSGKRLKDLTSEELDATDLTKVQAGQTGLMVTLGAYAYCKVDADIAPIQVGDLLVTSPTRGHAQKLITESIHVEPLFGEAIGGAVGVSTVTKETRAQAVGAILGKALGSLASGKGKIPVLVTLQ